MIPASQAVQLSAAVYDKSTDWHHLWATDDVVCGHRRIGANDVLVFRGSVTAEDWMRDADALPVSDHEVGIVHKGFLAGMDDLLEQVQAIIKGPIILTGHSLGGARARIAAAKLAVRHVPVTQVCVFGSPKPGYARLTQILQASKIAHTSYRNLSDPVPLVPTFAAFQHPDQWVATAAAPAPTVLGKLADHEVALYVKGVAALP